MRDIRWQWKRAGCPRAVMGNPIGKQDQVQKWREFCNVALNMTPHNNLWILADQQGEEAIRKQGAALRSYFPLAMAGENVWKLAVEFLEKWETGRLLGHNGAKWIMRKKKVKNVKPGVAYIHNDKLGRKEVVYNVPVEPPSKKGKKEKEEGEWFVRVPEPDAHCWKTMESMTDIEKCRVLKKVLACEVVWVQAGSPALAKIGKLSVQEVVNLVKCDRVLVRLWNYYQFKHDKRPDADWSQRFPFLKSRSAIFRQFESRGLDAELWDGSTKYVTDSSLFKDCPPYMGCDDDRLIEAMEKLAGHKKLSVDWRNKVLFVLTGSRLKSREIALAEGIVHIKWNDTGDVTSIAPFGNDPLEADIRSAEVKEAKLATKNHTFVLDLCEPVDLKLWKPQAFDTLNSQLQTWCPSHWTPVVFVPRQQNLSFLASMNHLSFVKLLEGKWVRRSQQKKSFPVGNNLYTEDDRMYILFKGDNLRANTSVVYEGKLSAGATAAVRVPQKVTQTDVSDIPFNACDWSHTSPARQGIVYGDMERNPAQFIQLLESITKKGEGVVFLGKPHARSVWEVLKARRHVIAMEGNSELLQFTIDLVKSEVNSGAHNCEFMVVTETRARAWNNKTDMWFKFSARKQNKIYDFLFLQTRPKRDTDAEYVRCKDHMFTLLDNYHGASRMNAKTFLERLQSLYFVESEEELTFGSCSSLVSTEDEETTGIEFDATADEEGSDTESLDLQYDQHSSQHGTGSSLAGPSTSPASLVSPMAKPAPGTTPMKLLQRMQALASGHRSLRPGSDIPPDHLSWTNANIHFLPEPQSRSTEADWGHDMIWHPGVIQPAIQEDSGAVRDGTSPPAGDRQPLRSEPEGACGGPGERETAKFAGIRTSPGKECGGPGDRETAKFAGIRTSSGKACGGPSDRESAKFVGIRTSSGKGGQPGILVQAGGAACGGREAHSSGIDTISGEVAALHAAKEGRVMDKEKEVEEGDTGEELEEGRDEGEEEEDEGEEGEEMELAGLLGGQEGEKVNSIQETTNGLSPYGEHREEDEYDDGTALGMETQVVTSLSAERDDYDVQAMTSVVDLQHRFNEARVAVSLTKPSVRIDIEEVIDGILGDHQMSAQPSSTPSVDDPFDVKPSGGSVVDFSPMSSPMLLPTIASGGERGIGGRQDVTSPKKTAAGTRALDVLALPAPSSPIKERRDKPAVWATAPGTAVTAIGSLRVLDDIERGLVPPDTVLSTLHDGQLRIAAKDILTLALTDDRVNDEVVNFYMALLGTTVYGTSDIPPGLRVFTFNSFFFSKLQLQGHSGVERWAKNVDLLEYDIIFVLVFKDNDHWILLSVSLRDNVLEIFYSFPCVVADSSFYLSVFELIVHYLECETSHRRSCRRWKSVAANVVIEGVPRQVDGVSCGVFMLMFATLLQRGDRPPFRFSCKNIPYIRRQLASCVLEFELS
ncbi:hypothetical protein CBR_g45868 [Chara braunii]|uniref:Ubiquitin-like protease family profile domain-containing protein n=1 Tax=Chara braunii TaxID=69332 RepID=A0A388LZG0_CHABU|nr:hypothetical protein CBR_g45868 [Chara braunii]|eukprot:GBG87714.1 hypothetical protein CBR_g45868 [Chara braunii]